jgi:hypothetical protein
MTTIRELLTHFRRNPKKPVVYALVGRSGTGKSFHADFVARKYRIDLIIDDGLIIRGRKIIAGQSAKQEKGILGAIRTALFAHPVQAENARRAILAERPRRILVIGTSIKMTSRILATLGLPTPSRIVPITEVSPSEEIRAALRIRSLEGKHIIPLPSVEVKRNYPHIFFESFKILMKGRNRRSRGEDEVIERTVVRPEYHRVARTPVNTGSEPEKRLTGTPPQNMMDRER